ncbi:hypothetical protein ACFT25_15805 [Streptomyces hydrogenans]|uniref:hypothetical protein n=1 Tax=Streptomyces hydrogenans TaxID=1873719 RepID=UPI003645EDDB
MLFTELARALAQALDAWAATVGRVTDEEKRPSRVGLVAELERDRRDLERLGRTRKRIDEPLLTYWLKGRDQLHAGRKRNRLPSAEDSTAIARVLAAKQQHSARRLPEIATEIADLARRLRNEGGTGWRDEVLASLTREDDADAAAGDGAPPSEDGVPQVAPLPAEGDPLDTPVTTEATSRPEDGGRPRHGQRSRLVVLVPTVAAAILTTVGITTAVVTGAAFTAPDDDDEGTATRSAQATATRSESTGAPQVPGIEKGTLGEDSRCSAPHPGPDVVTWRVCTRVQEDRVSFALKITNPGPATAMLKIRLEYARATAFHPCPKAAGARLLKIPASQTVVTDPGECAVPREKTPFAYQGIGWVLAQDAEAGSYEPSPTAHVHPDRVIWKPDLV